MPLEALRLKGINQKTRKKNEEEKPNKNLEMTDGFHSCSLKSISHKEAQVMQAVSEREHANNEEKGVSVHYGPGDKR